MCSVLTSVDMVRGIDLKAADRKCIHSDINILRLKVFEYLSDKEIHVNVI